MVSLSRKVFSMCLDRLSSASRLWQAVRYVPQVCSLANLPLDVAKKIRIEQVNSLSILTGVALVGFRGGAGSVTQPGRR